MYNRQSAQKGKSENKKTMAVFAVVFALHICWNYFVCERTTDDAESPCGYNGFRGPADKHSAERSPAAFCRHIFIANCRYRIWANKDNIRIIPRSDTPLALETKNVRGVATGKLDNPLERQSVCPSNPEQRQEESLNTRYAARYLVVGGARFLFAR